MRKLSAIAKESGCARIDWNVSNLNERGKKFYSRLGASISEEARLVRLSEDRIHALAESRS
jgi:hypothetical protein